MARFETDRPARAFVRAPGIVVGTLATLLILGSIGGVSEGTRAGSRGPRRLSPCPDAGFDGVADCSVPGCDATGLLCGDCEDSDPTIHPGAAETCNHKDEDCDGVVDEGSASLNDAVKIRDIESSPNDRLGSAVAALGDVTGDGVFDFAVSELLDEVPGAGDGGSVLVVSGATRGTVCRMIDPGARNQDSMDYALAVLGDVTEDGVPDLAVGDPFDDAAAGSDTGSVAIVSSADCSLVRRLTDPAGATGDQLGIGVAVIGDVTGDGTSEVVASSPGDDEPRNGDVGSFSIFSGSDGSFVRKVLDPGVASGDRLGSVVVALGDVTGRRRR